MKSGRPFPLPCAVDYMYIPESGPSLSEQCPFCRQRNHEFSQKTSIDRKKQQIQCVTYGTSTWNNWYLQLKLLQSSWTNCYCSLHFCAARTFVQLPAFQKVYVLWLIPDCSWAWWKNCKAVCNSVQLLQSLCSHALLRTQVEYGRSDIGKDLWEWPASSAPSCTLPFFQVADPAYILSPCCSEFPAPVVED